jgi:hypothetical protein
MNKVNTALHEHQAATEKSKAKKLELVKEAKANTECKKLQGQGIANMRSGHHWRLPRKGDQSLNSTLCEELSCCPQFVLPLFFLTLMSKMGLYCKR